jgi:tetratricopeptide (TPR) repeat protein
MRDFCRRSAVVLLCAFAALIAVQSAAFAGVRLALVLGNGKYEAVPALDNPSNDAADLAQALRGVGFEVIEQRDATRDAMAKAVREFSERLRGADVALFFYAGHGLQMNGENYLLPVDAKIESPADVRFNTINLSDIQQEMESGGSGRANIIILDACRNNPFAEKLASSGRAISTRGLGRIDATGEGSLIVYSTQPNNVALDGAGRNSPFTAALLKYVATPGLEVRQMISKVRGDVLQATERRQTPWDSSSLVGDVYLAGAPASAPIVVVQNAPAAPAPIVVVQNAPAAPAPAPPAATAADQAPRTTAPPPPPPAVTASGPAGDCERLAAPAPPFATPDQIKTVKTRNWAPAIAACEAAVSANPSDARLQYLLGVGYDTTKNYLEAARHYGKAADAGYADAQDSLGVLFATGRGLVKDPQRAFDLLNKAALGGSPGGMNDLGAMYANGLFVKEDDAQALGWFEKAIEAGNSFGLAEAGVMYFNGKGTPRDYNAAAQYFQQAADLGDGYSLKFLAILDERGLLGPVDLEKAGALRAKAELIDPGSQNPDVPPPQKTLPARRASGAHYVRIYRYRFFGCNWLWC